MTHYPFPSSSQMTGAGTILIVDDDLVIQQRLLAYFSQEGYRTLLADEGEAMWRILQAEPVSLVLLDINLPGRDGISLARELRAQHPAIGIILVSGRTDEVDTIVGLEVGADDYVTKPFNPRVLLARAKSLLRRACGPFDAAGDVPRICFAGWQLDMVRRRLYAHDGSEVTLTRGEFDLLSALAQHPDAVMDRERLTRVISGSDWHPADRTVDVLIRRLRAKLDTADGQTSLIATVRGEGYRLSAEVRPA